MKAKLASLAMVVALVSPFSASATPTDDVVAKVQSAYDYIEANGKKGMRTMNKEMESKWLEGELYPFVVDCKTGFALVHVKKSVLGVNLVDKLKDKETGKLFLKEMCDVTEPKPEGTWTSYFWAKPNESKASQKVTYVRRSTKFPSYIIGVGMYNDTLDVNELNK